MGESEKYAFRINGPGGNSAHGKVLSAIKRGSMVLECGCATGYMTRYLVEELCCTVDIVEVDPECYEAAVGIANDGYNGDLDKTGWYEYYRDRRYDYVLFADVLEHLRDPAEVLERAVRLLSGGGSVVISIPNVCHNDLLIQMYYDNWNYTRYGLLDDGHIRFWGREQLGALAKKCGMKIVKLDGVVIRTQCTEQAYPGGIDADLMAALRKRPYGEVFQWVMVCERRKA